MKGKFITFEGSEGCGKSTQSRLLAGYLRKNGYKALLMREPGGTKISEKIREILLDKKNNSMCGATEMLLYMAARAQIVYQIIKPALVAGNIVICDRFLDSTLAYQGYGLGVDIGLIKFVGKFSTYNLSPDLTIFLDLPIKDGLKHREFTKDRIEMRSLKYHQRVRKGYLKLASLEPKRIKIVKVAPEKLQTQSDIRAIVDKMLK